MEENGEMDVAENEKMAENKIDKGTSSNNKKKKQANKQRKGYMEKKRIARNRSGHRKRKW